MTNPDKNRKAATKSIYAKAGFRASLTHLWLIEHLYSESRILTEVYFKKQYATDLKMKTINNELNNEC